jgi:hypothetical protein
MQRQPRLGRSEVVARLRALAARHGGAVSPRLLVTHDGAAARSLRIHFPSFAMACRAAGVAVARPPPRRGLRRSARAVWSKDRVVGELRRLDARGAPTGWAELMQRGRGALVRAAAAHAGGLQQARVAAGVEPPRRRPPVKRWDRAAIVAAIQAQVRARKPLASSKAPQRLVAAARWHFGSWEAALAAAGIEPDAVRLQRAPVTRDEVIARIRGMARRGTAVRASTLKPVVKLDTVRKLFGSIEAAVRVAGIEPVHTHGNLKWTRARVIDELKARAARGELRLSRRLQRAAQLYFGGAHAARAAAGLASPARTRRKRRRTGAGPWTRRRLQRALRAPAVDLADPDLVAACVRQFGSVTAAHAALARGRGRRRWTRATVIAELQARSQRGLKGVGRLLRAPAVRLFGSTEAALAAAARTAPRVRLSHVR